MRLLVPKERTVVSRRVLLLPYRTVVESIQTTHLVAGRNGFKRGQG